MAHSPDPLEIEGYLVGSRSLVKIDYKLTVD